MFLSTALWSKDSIFAFSILSGSQDLVSTVLSIPAVKYLVFEPVKQESLFYKLPTYIFFSPDLATNSKTMNLSYHELCDQSK